jgi:hypothetical protein
LKTEALGCPVDVEGVDLWEVVEEGDRSWGRVRGEEDALVSSEVSGGLGKDGGAEGEDGKSNVLDEVDFKKGNEGKGRGLVSLGGVKEEMGDVGDGGG